MRLPRMFAACVLAVTASLASACDKAKMEECDRGCRNYFSLHYWETAEQEIAALPEEQRAEARRQKEADYLKRLEENLQLCIQKCTSGATSDRAKCWEKAKTTAEAKKCE